MKADRPYDHAAVMVPKSYVIEFLSEHCDVEGDIVDIWGVTMADRKYAETDIGFKLSVERADE